LVTWAAAISSFLFKDNCVGAVVSYDVKVGSV